MTDKTSDQRFVYVSGKTLGRSGYVASPSDRLSERVRHLDALMCLITSSDGPDQDDEGGFFSLNREIQRATLELASSLATEVHELHEEALLMDLRHRDQKPSQLHPAH